MKPDLKKALEELAQAHDELAVAIEWLNEKGGIEQAVALKRARDDIAAKAYKVDKAYRPPSRYCRF